VGAANFTLDKSIPETQAGMPVASNEFRADGDTNKKLV
jgi:hypothetical protein